MSYTSHQARIGEPAQEARRNRDRESQLKSRSG